MNIETKLFRGSTLSKALLLSLNTRNVCYSFLATCFHRTASGCTSYTLESRLLSADDSLSLLFTHVYYSFRSLHLSIHF